MRPFLLLVLCLALAGCARDPWDTLPPDQTQELTVPLENESFYIAQFEAPWPAHVRAHVQVVNGSGEVDAWLATGASCSSEAFTSGTLEAVEKAQGVTNATLEADVPAGMICLPMDNASDFGGAASPQGPVEIHYRIEAWRR